jgi:hypothetical protein
MTKNSTDPAVAGTSNDVNDEAIVPGGVAERSQQFFVGSLAGAER